MTLSIAGYGFLYGLLQRFGRVPVIIGVFPSFIFTFANNLFVNANHLQLFAIYYAPVAAYFGTYAIVEIHTNKIRSLIAGGAAGLLYGLLFSTGYYTAWFFGLSLLIFTPIFIFLSWRAVRAWLVAGPVRIGTLGLAFVDGFVIGLIPFMFIYGPAMKVTGSNDFDEYLLYAPTFADIANVGANVIWTHVLDKVGFALDGRISGGGEQSFALTPGLQLLLLLSLMVGLRTRYWGISNRDELTRAVIIAGVIVCIALFFITIKYREQSVFLILFRVVPGAGAIRAGYRAMIVANFFAAISVGLAIDRIWLMLSRQSVTELKIKFVCSAIVGLMMLGLVEQVNLTQNSSVSRAFERIHFASVNSASTDCESFYIANEPDQPTTIVQIDAMLVAQRVGIPTINGYSGNRPIGWNLYDSTDANYEKNARAWAVRRGIERRLCRFDMAKGTFARRD